MATGKKGMVQNQVTVLARYVQTRQSPLAAGLAIGRQARRADQYLAGGVSPRNPAPTQSQPRRGVRGWRYGGYLSPLRGSVGLGPATVGLRPRLSSQRPSGPSIWLRRFRRSPDVQYIGRLECYRRRAVFELCLKKADRNPQTGQLTVSEGITDKWRMNWKHGKLRSAERNRPSAGLRVQPCASTFPAARQAVGHTFVFCCGEMRRYATFIRWN